MSAYLSKRPLKNGHFSLQVKWKDRDTQKMQSQTFDGLDAERAVEFKLAVEAAGDRWPRGWIPGKGWAREWRDVTTLDDVATEWLGHMRARVRKELLTSAQVDRYERMYVRRIKPVLGELEFADVTLADVEAWSEPLLNELKGKTVRDYFSCVLNPILGD